MNFVERYYTSADGLKLYYRDYSSVSPTGKLPVLCLPGITRNARDFEFIADRMARQRRVLCADMRGRGRSQYDPDPGNYLVSVETQDVTALLDHAQISRTVVLGTSRGGIIAMALATVKPGVVAAAILNDIGPEIEKAGLDRLATQVGKDPGYVSWQDCIAALKRGNAGIISGLSEAGWEAFAKARFREQDSQIVADYDPNLIEAFRERAAVRVSSADIWKLFDALAPIPVLELRGEHSDLLSVSGVEKMKAVKPDLIAVTVKGRGHVPFLDEPEAITAIDAFLASAP